MNNLEAADKELAILENIRESGSGDRESIGQRDLARSAGISLGLTNILMKRLASKGLITFKRVNGRNLRYALTPEGIEEVARRSWRYLNATLRTLARWRDAVAALLSEAASRDCSEVLLVGRSELGFMIERFAEKLGMTVRRVDVLPSDPAGHRTLVLIGEMDEMDPPLPGGWGELIHLRGLLTGSSPGSRRSV